MLAGKRHPNMFFNWNASEYDSKANTVVGVDDEDGDGDVVKHRDADVEGSLSAQTSINSNVLEFYKVSKLRKGFDGQPVNTYQKPLALCQFIVDRYCVGGDWILELCAGSASFAVAALRASKNAITLDSNARQVREARTRLTNAFTENKLHELGLEEASKEGPVEDVEEVDDDATQITPEPSSKRARPDDAESEEENED